VIAFRMFFLLEQYNCLELYGTLLPYDVGYE
jgi:hypothetical protein